MKYAIINLVCIAWGYSLAVVKKHGPDWFVAVVLGVMLAWFAAQGF